MHRFGTLLFVLVGISWMGCAKPGEPTPADIPIIPPGRSQTEFRGGARDDPRANPVPSPPRQR